MIRTIRSTSMLCAVTIGAMVRTDAQTPAPAVPTFNRDVAPVWWGDQTFEEMMFTGLTFSVDPAPAPPAVAGAH